MSTLKVKKYKNFEIHYVTGNGKVAPRWKYDVYQHGLYFNSFNSLSKVKEYISSVIWTRKNVAL